jgi:putative MATE family efflux protein
VSESPPAIGAPGAVSRTLPRGVTQPIPGELLRLAAPMLASLSLRVAYQWIDALWVRGLGVDATAAVTTSIFIMWAVYSLNDVFAIGVTAYVSQLLGAGERHRAGVAAWKGVRASATLGLIGTTIGLLFAKQIYGLMDPDPRMVATGASFLRICLMGSPLFMIALTCESIMRSAGDTRTPLIIDLVSVGACAVLDPLLIYGIGPFPRMGVAGAGVATVSAWALMVLGYALCAVRGHRALPLARHAEGEPVHIVGMAKVGMPAALIGVLFSAVYIAFARAASQFGPSAHAIVGVANRIEALQYIFAVAIGGAGAALVGQNLGARQPERAEKVIRTGLWWMFWLSTVLIVIIAGFPQVFLGLFSRDPELIRMGVPYLRVLSTCLYFVGFEIVVAESVLGSGHTKVISFIFTSFSLLRIPLAFLVPKWTGGGLVSIAWLISITCAIRASLIVGWAARGTWKRGLASELHAAEGTGAASDSSALAGEQAAREPTPGVGVAHCPPPDSPAGA